MARPSRLRRSACLGELLVIVGCAMGLEPDFARYAMDGRRVIFYAREAVDATGGAAIRPEHLLLGLLHDDVDAWRVFERKGVKVEDLKVNLRAMLPREAPPNTPDIPLSSGSRKVLEHAQREAEGRGNDHVKSEDILIGLLLEDGSVRDLLVNSGVRIDDLRGSAG